ncbi:MAG: hypothetical protein QOK21_3305 [Solirubrobacteraceae bacterium]|jgi:hypothetical protein|nr:hypothetical protein [Solirubrobacteraceae bacterium]
MRFVRYGLPIVLLLVGIGFLVIQPNSTGIEGFCAGAGAAMALLLLNVLFRAGVAGDRDRDREEAARTYFDAHGYWPDEAPPPPPPEPKPRGEPRLPRGADGGAPVAPSHAAGAHRRQGPRIGRNGPQRRR